MLNFSIDTQKCTKCGLCAADCPVFIIDMENGYPTIAADKESSCYKCQHCFAICPTGALSLLGLNPTDSQSLTAGNFSDPDKFEMLIKGRRTVRRYKDENLDPALFQRLLDVA